MTISKRVEQYLKELEAEKSAATVKNYRHYLARFVDWVSDTFGEKTDLNQQVVEHYKYWLQNRGHAPSTLNYHLIVVRGLIRFLRENGLTDLDPGELELLEVEQDDSIDFLDVGELEKILQVPWKGIGHFQALRSKLAVGLLYSTGMRLSEVTALNVDNIYEKKLEVQGSGRKLFIGKFLEETLRKYLAERSDRDSALFVRKPKAENGKDLRVSERTIERAVTSAGKQAGITRGVSPHMLRHTLGVDLRSAGMSLESVQNVLGYETHTDTIQYPQLPDRPFAEFHERYLDAYGG